MMQDTRRLYKVLLAALMLLAGSLNATIAGASLHRRDAKGCTMLQAARPGLPSDVFTAGNAAPREMVLHQDHAPAPGLHSGEGGARFRYKSAEGNTFYALPHHGERLDERRRWQLLCSYVRYAQLAAHYPAHGFW